MVVGCGAGVVCGVGHVFAGEIKQINHSQKQGENKSPHDLWLDFY